MTYDIPSIFAAGWRSNISIQSISMVHFDFEQLKKYLDNDTMVLKGFLAILKRELPVAYEDLSKALQQQDLKMLLDASHKLKGTALSAALPQVILIASQLNKLKSVDQPLIQNLLEQLNTEIQLIAPLIDAQLAQLSK